MAGTRWQPLFVFLAGSLSGVSLLGLLSAGGQESLPSPSGDGQRATYARSAVANADAGAGDEQGGSDQPEADSAAATTADADKVVTAAPTPLVSAEGDGASADAGHSVADVLARLEAEYHRMATARAAAPADDVTTPLPEEPPVERSASFERSASSDPGPALATVQHAAIARQRPAAAASDTRSPTPLPQPAAPVVAIEEASVRTVVIREVSENTSPDSAQQQVTAELQRYAALQQISAAQQFALLQYLQFLPAAPSRTAPAARTDPRRPRNGRIIPATPSSISATDNPWGFTYPPTVLVR
jgi:hypothetical protein